MPHPILQLVHASWNFARERKKSLVVAYVLFVLANLVLLAEPYVIGLLFNSLQQGGDEILPRSLTYLGMYACVTISFWIIHSLGRILERKTSFFITKHFREEMFRMITLLPMKWHRSHHSGETHDKIEKAAAALLHFSGSVSGLIGTVIKIIVSVGMILWFVPKFGVIALVIMAAVVYAVIKFDRILVKNRRLINTREHAVAKRFYDYVSNIKTLISLRLENLAEREYGATLMHIFPFMRKEIYASEAKWFFLSMAMNFTMFAVLLLYIIDSIRSPELFLLGNLVALHGYISRFSATFFSFSGQWEGLVWQSTDLAAAQSITSSYAQLEEKRPWKRIPTDWKSIVVDNVWFQYEDQENHKHHIDGATIGLSRGAKIAFVGESGSGKSTILTLLRGLDMPQRGNITIDGEPADGLHVLSQITTLIPQEPELFDSSIAYNITTGIAHTPDEISQACEMARFSRVLDKIPGGLNAHIHEKGVNLSGGQKQRLALARGLFTASASSLILMDEPTSSVDPENELAIYKNIFTAFSDRCVVSSIHRLHLLPLFDVIYVMDQGKVIEQGTYIELLAKPEGALRKLWNTYIGTLPSEAKNNVMPELAPVSV